MTKTCVVAGSFDPVTAGHMDLIREAARIFDIVYAAVLDSAGKKYMFSRDERLALLKACCGSVSGNVHTLSWDGLLVDLLDEVHADTIVRGIRDARDVEFERQMAAVNQKLRPGTVTIWLSGSSENWAVSSTIVRELLTFGADVSAFVPPEALSLLEERKNPGSRRE